MKSQIILCLALFSAAFCSIDNPWTASSPVSGSTYGKRLFDNPAALFPDASFPVLAPLFERVKIQSTWRGFYLRADTQPGFRSEYDPSETGLYLDVSVRGSEEISKFADSQKLSGKLTKRTIEFPALQGSSDALRITLIYGVKANAGAISSINKDMEDMIKTYKASAASP